MYKLRIWVNINKINLYLLSYNINAKYFFEKNIDKIINWYNLSENINAIHILEQNIDKIDWYKLSYNINAINILENNIDKIKYESLSYNPSIFELDYKYLDKMCNIYKEELIQKTMHPNKFVKYCDDGYDIEDILDFI